MYFKRFNKILYGFDKKNFKTVTDIMQRIKVRDKVLNNVVLYNKYDVKSGDTPETIAYKHFGSADLHWVILLTNNIVDRYYDFPLSEQEFEIFLNDKYDNPGGIHHYEKDQSSGSTEQDGPGNFDHKIEVNSTDTDGQSVSNYEYEQRLQDQKRQIKLLDKAYLNTFVEEFERLVKR